MKTIPKPAPGDPAQAFRTALHDVLMEGELLRELQAYDNEAGQGVRGYTFAGEDLHVTFRGGRAAEPWLVDQVRAWPGGWE